MAAKIYTVRKHEKIMKLQKAGIYRRINKVQWSDTCFFVERFLLNSRRLLFIIYFNEDHKEVRDGDTIYSQTGS